MLAAAAAPLGQRHVPAMGSSQRRLPRTRVITSPPPGPAHPAHKTPRGCAAAAPSHCIRMETLPSPKSHHRPGQLLPLPSPPGAPGAQPGTLLWAP